jgi:hypothetical protein
MKHLQSPALRRAGALVIATAITSTTLLSAAVPAQAHPAGDRAVSASASWLTSQLTDGILHNEEYDYDDLGLSADIAFALDAVGGQDATVTDIVDAIEPDVESWVTAGTPARVYAGSLAKMVSVVQASGQDPESFNGTDQVSRLEDRVSSSAPLTGRLEDAGVDPNVSWDADFVNVIGQSFAARALAAAGSPRADDATTFLLEQQCAEGFFRATLTTDKSSLEQGCVSGTHTGSVDTTALAVINILDTPGASTAATDAAAEAATWLEGQQAADGSFTAGGTEGYNANSTGLAGWALAEAGRAAGATKAASWLRGLQVADLAPCAAALASDNGAVLLKADEVPAVRKAGSIDVATRERARRATAQALPALANVPAGSAVSLSAPTTAVENSTVTVTVTGLGAGEPACVSLGGTATSITGTGAPVTATFTLPAGAATRTFSLAVLGGTSTATTSVTATPTTPTTPTATPTTTPTTPVADSVVGDLRASRVERVRHHRFRLAVACKGSEVCEGSLVVRTRRVVEGTDSAARARRLVVARATYTVEPGERSAVVLKVRRAARVLLRDGRVRVVARQSTPGADEVRTAFWLKRA